jgi:cyanamide hydratase
MSKYGFTAQPRDINFLLKGRKNIHDPSLVMVADIKLPETSLAKRVHEYAKTELREETFNHSMRVYYFGRAIQSQQFPHWELSAETYFVTALLHDIGTTEKNMAATKMSFEFYGGLLARNLLIQDDVELAEAVAEAVIRHQDLGTTGKITSLGLLIQLATILDNMGSHADLIHQGTIDDVVAAYPRKKWSSCFAATIREENRQKPWCHTTALGEEDFPNGVLGNKLMERYEID